VSLQITREAIQNKVLLLERNADDLHGIEQRAFDLVVLNSVIQYFPSIEYLVRVLKGAVRRLAPGGRIFIGDVRNLLLLKAFHASVQFFQSANELDIKELKQRWTAAIQEETELLLNPAFFRLLMQEIPEIKHVEVRPKRGRCVNELNRYRYDVILHTAVNTSSQSSTDWLDWQKERLSLPLLHRLLTEQRCGSIGLLGIPNARLFRDIQVLEWMSSEESTQTVGDLRQLLQSTSETGIQLDDLYSCAEQTGYELSVSWAAGRTDGSFDAVFWQKLHGNEPYILFFDQPVKEQMWSEYANEPMRTRVIQNLVPELRKYLQGKLPEYMVPSAFVGLDKIPVTPHGKIDRNALPAPSHSRPSREKAAIAPRTKEEEILCRIWSEVLRVERVGIEDNFFELGGDSILSVQIVGRANQAGLRLSVREMFQHQTIAALAEVVSGKQEQVKRTAISSGAEVPLTPIQHWFFEQQPEAAHHFNQAVLLESRRALQAELLSKAVERVVEHHEALGMRYVREEDGRWKQSYGGGRGGAMLRMVDVSNLEVEQGRKAVEAGAKQAQGSLELRGGDLVRVVYFRMGGQERERLLWVVHHLVVDGVSWRILLEDVQRVYGQLEKGEEAQLPGRSSSYQQWAEGLREYGRKEELRGELEYWAKQVECEGVGQVERDHEAGENTVESTARVVKELSVEETRKLLREVPKAYRTQINDVLLTALGASLGRWNGSKGILVEVEGHGREEIVEGVDVTRTVGWFTSIYPVRLHVEVNGAGGWGKELQKVKEQLRAIPQHGIGYGILKYLKGSKELQGRGGEVSFNYLGQLDQVFTEDGIFEPGRESAGPTCNGKQKRPYVLNVDGRIVGGRLQLTWTYSRNLHHQETIDQIAELFLQYLQNIVGTFESTSMAVLPSDHFPDANLSQADLKKLASRFC
jgi:non-ribosomal peptide synthase protein (TIGR01720 family)